MGEYTSTTQCLLIIMTPLLLLLLVAPLAAPAPHQEPRATAVYATCYSEVDQTGFSFKFTDSSANLTQYSFNNAMDSVTITGMWVFYDYENYNTDVQGKVYWAAGIDYFFNLAPDYRNTISSMRFVGHPDILNADTWTVFDETLYQGDSMYGTDDAETLDTMNIRASSMALTGNANWTVFSDTNYGGLSACITSGPYHYESGIQELTVAHVPDLVDIGVFGNAIRSIRKGCSSTRWITPHIQVISPTHKGATGYFNLP